jgi:hypothetical protein
MKMFAPAAEHAVLRAGDDDRAHLGVLEPEPLDRVGQLDVDAEVVAVELELVAGAVRLLVPHVEPERRDAPLDLELPVTIPVGVGVQRDAVHGRPSLPIADPDLILGPDLPGTSSVPVREFRQLEAAKPDNRDEGALSCRRFVGRAATGGAPCRGRSDRSERESSLRSRRG